MALHERPCFYYLLKTVIIKFQYRFNFTGYEPSPPEPKPHEYSPAERCT